MSDERSRTSLTPYAAQMRDPDPDGAHHLAARMWHADGSLVLRKASIDRLDWQDRELLNALGAKIYGPRGK